MGRLITEIIGATTFSRVESVPSVPSTSFGWGKGGNVTSAGWQVKLCDPAWHVSSRIGEAGVLRT